MEKETIRINSPVPQFVYSILAPIGLALIVAIAIRRRRGERRRGYQKRLESGRNLKVGESDNDHSELPVHPRGSRRRKKQPVSIPQSAIASSRRRNRVLNDFSQRDVSESSEIEPSALVRTVSLP